MYVYLGLYLAPLVQRPAAGSVHGTPGATHPTRTAAAEAERGAAAP